MRRMLVLVLMMVVASASPVVGQEEETEPTREDVEYELEQRIVRIQAEWLAVQLEQQAALDAAAADDPRTGASPRGLFRGLEDALSDLWSSIQEWRDYVATGLIESRLNLRVVSYTVGTDGFSVTFEPIEP